MAAANQGQGQGQDRNNGGVREQAQNLAQNVQQGVEQAGERLRQGYDATREGVMHRYRRAEGMVARNPAPSVLIGFGVGFGLGLALTAMLTHREETWAERYLPDSLRDLPDSIRKARIPQGVRDAHIPDSVHSTFHHLAESIRDLPSLIARAAGR